MQKAKTQKRNYYVALSPRGFANETITVRVSSPKEAYILANAYELYTNYKGKAWRLPAKQASGQLISDLSDVEITDANTSELIEWAIEESERLEELYYTGRL